MSKTSSNPFHHIIPTISKDSKKSIIGDPDTEFKNDGILYCETIGTYQEGEKTFTWPLPDYLAVSLLTHIARTLASDLALPWRNTYTSNEKLQAAKEEWFCSLQQVNGAVAPPGDLDSTTEIKLKGRFSNKTLSFNTGRGGHAIKP
jgi:hypothetical protein